MFVTITLKFAMYNYNKDKTKILSICASLNEIKVPQDKRWCPKRSLLENLSFRNLAVLCHPTR